MKTERERAKQREYRRRYREAHPDKVREERRAWWAANPGKAAEYKRLSRERDPEKAREQDRLYYQANRERIAAERKLKRSKPQRRPPGYTSPGRVLERKQRRELLARAWHEQGGYCYLCQRPVPLDEANLDHDHRCCPAGECCAYCIRGAVHGACNWAIGQAADSPELLEALAANLRAKLAEIDARLAVKPAQDELSLFDTA